MHRLTLAALAALVTLIGCGKPASDRTTFRDAGLNLYSNAVFEPQRMLGDWQQAAAFVDSNLKPCAPGAVRFANYDAANQTIQVDGALCLSGERPRINTPAQFSAPGRMALSGADPQGLGQPWWVIWVDTDYRTMVVGTPSGAFGFILNRGGPLPPDRMNAAREILDWNGYDLTQLKRL